MNKNAPSIYAKNRAEFRRWLRANHTASAGVWLIFYKMASGKTTVSYEQAVEEALCFGWIDSTVKRIDDERYQQWFAPRKPKSMWSASNKERVERLVKARKMTRAGLAAITLAKSNGSWTALDDAEALRVPDDFLKALAKAGGRKQFDAFSPSSRKAILYWISAAKRDETRQRRIEQAARMAANGLRAQLDQE